MIENNNTPDFLVRIRCMTFNHAPFIEDTMNGFCMQQTNFPFIAIICDDASTDGEQEVIRKYLTENFLQDDIYHTWENEDAFFFYSRHKVNVNCYFFVVLLKNNYYSQGKDKEPLWNHFIKESKYIATCEGDDYWIAPNKLQKQVDFLETHQDYVLCCHETKRYNQNTGELYFQKHRILDKFPDGYTFDSSSDGWNYDGWLSQTLTNLYRSDFEGNEIFSSMKNRYDVIFQYFIRKAGKCFLMPDVMSVYRIHNGGMNSGSSFVSFYKLILRAFEELNQVDQSKDALMALQRHLRVNMGNLILLREWKVIDESLRIISKVSAFGEYARFCFFLPFHGIIQVGRAFCDIMKSKIEKYKH